MFPFTSILTDIFSGQMAPSNVDAEVEAAAVALVLVVVGVPELLQLPPPKPLAMEGRVRAKEVV